MIDKDDVNGDFCFTEEGRLRHENNYLKERIANLENFKSKFFDLNHQLIEAKEKIGILEQQSSLDALKERVFSEGASGTSAAAGQTGTILNFFQDSFSAANYQDLIMSIFQSVEGLDVDMAVQIKKPKEVVSYAIDDTNKDANIQLIEQHKSAGDVVEGDDFILINHSHLSMITKFSPELDENSLEDLKEYIKIVALGSNTRIDTLANRAELEDLRTNIYKIFKKTNQSFEQMQEDSDRQTIKISELFINYENSLRETIARMNLSESYVSLLDIIIKDARNELNILLTSSLTLDDQFMGAMKKLEHAYAREYTE